MKKNILKIGILSVLSLGGVLSLNSCRDAIYIEQDGEINDKTFFSNVNNLEKFLQGDVYKNADNADAVFATSVFTDEVKPGSSNGGHQINDFRHYINSTNTFASSIWLSNYRLINRATRLIEGAKRVTPESSEVAKYNNVIAQARVLRALAYLQLETYYSEDMTNDSALGVMIVNEVPTTATKLSRSTNAEVYATIEADLVAAEPYLEQSSRYLVSIDLVNAIRARLYLYKGDYNKAKLYAQKVISDSGLSLTQAGSFTASQVSTNTWKTDFYADASNSAYRRIWTDNSQGEVIFALSRPASNTSFTNLAGYYNTNNSTNRGNPKWEMGRNLFNILDTTSGDIRRYAYLDNTSTPNNNYLTEQDRSKDALIIDKYPGKSTYPLKNDLKVFRLSEMYLILAEVAVKEGDLVTAANYVGQIRVARNYLGSAVTPTYANETEAWADILKERRVELAFEGHRYIDLKRLASKANVTMDRNQTDEYIGVAPSTLENGSYKYTLPIPLSEISANNQIQQNKGY